MNLSHELPLALQIQTGTRIIGDHHCIIASFGNSDETVIYQSGNQPAATTARVLRPLTPEYAAQRIATAWRRHGHECCDTPAPTRHAP
eukprot:12382684-Alexandrium_andersonii.AAC.1